MIPVDYKEIFFLFSAGKFLSSQRKYCSGMNRDQPIDSKECEYAFSFGTWPLTLHDDK